MGFPTALGVGDRCQSFRTVIGLSGASSISAGGYHNCAITSAGMKCWGYNYYGQLGMGTNAAQTGVVAVTVISGTVTSIATGEGHTCALISGGHVKCWGYNSFGQLGDNTPLIQSSPTNLASSSMTGTYTYDPAHAHAVQSVSVVNNYSYDANGNMTCRLENGIRYNQVFNAENELIVVQALKPGIACPAADTEAASANVDATTRFYYDGNGDKVKTLDPNADYTLYYFGMYEERYHAGALSLTTQYYPAGGAMRVTQGTVTTLYFILSDHLITPRF